MSFQTNFLCHFLHAHDNIGDKFAKFNTQHFGTLLDEISINALYRAQAAFQQEGLTGLLRERPGPRRAHKFTNEVMDFIEQALSQDSSLTTVNLRQMIQECFGISVHRRSIERSLTRRQKKG